jgi:sensor domain CHASE-containing protein
VILTVFRYIFIVLALCFVLLAAIYLRRSENITFYRFRTAQAKQTRLKQELWQQQLQLESLINPASVSQAIKNKIKMAD